MKMDSGFNVENLTDLIMKTWKNRKRIKEEMKPIIKREQEKAKESARYLKKYLNQDNQTGAL